MFTFTSTVRFSETDLNGALHLCALTDYFQDCSVFHSEAFGVGGKRLAKDHLAWVINAWQIVIHRYPALCEEIVIGTQPYELKGFLGLRNFVMETPEGETLAVANSVWSLVDLRSMLPERIPQYLLDAFPLAEKLPMEYASRKIRFPKEEGERLEEKITILAQHLDTNHHVNNGQYIRMALHVFGGDARSIRQMRAEYRKQALLGDTICFRVQTRSDAGDRIDTIALEDEAGDAYCVVELTS